MYVRKPHAWSHMHIMLKFKVHLILALLGGSMDGGEDDGSM